MWLMLKDPGSTKCLGPSADFSPSVLCPGLESHPTASGATPHGNPLRLPELPAQDLAVSFSISSFHKVRITCPSHSTVLPPYNCPPPQSPPEFPENGWRRWLCVFSSGYVDKHLLTPGRVLMMSLHPSLAW